MNEPDGRWFSFNVDGNTLILLEKKDLPTHLASMNCADSVIALSNVLREMEDQGEVPRPQASANHKNHCLVGCWVYHVLASA